MTVEQIRALGFDWPGSDSMEQYAVESGGGVDLDATLTHYAAALKSIKGN